MSGENTEEFNYIIIIMYLTANGLSPGVSGYDACTTTYFLTPWSRVLLEELTVNFAASQEIPRIYGTRKSLTVPTSARHLSLS
jgi:hypothetical protein